MKKIGIILLVIVAAFAIVSFFFPSKIRVERSTQIQAPVKLVFNQVNTLSTWQHWSYWDQIDPNMISEYEGPESGAGAVHKWESKNDSVGKGSLTIVESTEPNTIITSLYFEGMGSSMGGWNFDEGESGVTATMYMEIEMPFHGRIFPGMMMKDWLGKDFDKSLSGLKAHCEAMPAQPESKWTVEVVETESALVLTTKLTTTPAEMPTVFGDAFGKILMEMGNQKLHQAGPVFAIYHNYSPESIDMEPGIPVDKAGKTVGDINAYELPSAKAMKIDYYGSYDRMEEAHGFIDEWAKANNMTFAGSPWEVYVTDPSNEPDTTKWLTKIYYPVQ